MRQLELFGGEAELKTISKTPARETIKSRWRKMYGYLDGKQCKECKYLGSYTANKKWYKCTLMGMSNSSATDIRLKDIACNRYEERNEK